MPIVLRCDCIGESCLVAMPFVSNHVPRKRAAQLLSVCFRVSSMVAISTPSLLPSAGRHTRGAAIDHEIRFRAVPIRAALCVRFGGARAARARKRDGAPQSGRLLCRHDHRLAHNHVRSAECSHHNLFQPGMEKLIHIPSSRFNHAAGRRCVNLPSDTLAIRCVASSGSDALTRRLRPGMRQSRRNLFFYFLRLTIDRCNRLSLRGIAAARVVSRWIPFTTRWALSASRRSGTSTFSSSRMRSTPCPNHWSIFPRSNGMLGASAYLYGLRVE